MAGRLTAYVSDEPALLDWVKRRHPTEVIETVRDAYERSLLDSAREYGEAVDRTTGEVVPGITVRYGQPYITFRPERGMEGIVVDRWTELTTQLLALPEARDGVR